MCIGYNEFTSAVCLRVLGFGGGGLGFKVKSFELSLGLREFRVSSYGLGLRVQD